MKTREEIEQLAKEEYKDNLHNPFFTAAPMGYIKGYTQCQEEMAKDVEYWQGEFDHWHQQAMEMSNKYKYTEEDMMLIRNKIVSILPTGDISAWDMIQAVSKYTKWLDEYINSLNKQD